MQTALTLGSRASSSSSIRLTTPEGRTKEIAIDEIVRMKLTVIYGPVDIGIGGHPHEGEVGEVHFRKRHGKGVVLVLRVLSRIQYKDG